MTSTEREILEQLAEIRKQMPNGELKRIEKRVEHINKEVSHIKETLLDPHDGVIVETNKNTAARKEHSSKLEDLDKINLDLEKIKDWKGGVVKSLWTGFTAIIVIIFKNLAELFK
jgi:alpha-mannosidase